MAIDLKGRPIVITGASSGIGEATALQCAAAGMPVVVAARRADRLDALVDRITSGGGRALSARVDVTDPAACRDVIARAEEAFGPVHAVYANAGYGYERAFHESSDEQVRAIFETNFWGSLNIIRPALERMIPRRGGHVLLCSSCLSKIGVPYMSAYSATKAAQDHFARGMRHELADLGIHVSTVHPVLTATELFDEVARRSGGRRLYSHGRGLLVQSPVRVARATVRCLRKPRGEVWTSLPTRLALAAATAFPGLADAVMRRWGIPRAARANANPTAEERLSNHDGLAGS
ncbi:MAG: SDR family NAD(P)-dependent oxidoreductase [Phycisphaeraceae bacterium]|nr:SDR family NAD(P)-dependent oxidoreductase [Phycisphaerae bacterium]MBX3392606.1 SDR family NAD(P)-dependent oxidoreductase [Phycisphaeraceae bacterium]